MSHISDARLQQIGEYNQRIDELEKELILADNQNQLHVERIQQFQAKLHANTHQNQLLQQTISQLNSKIVQIDSHNEQLTNQNLQLETTVDQLQASETALKSQIETLNQTVTDQKREIKMLKLGFAEMEKTVAENQKSLAQLNQVIAAKTLEVNQLISEKTILLNELALLNSTLHDKDKSLQDLESKIAALIHQHQAFVKKAEQEHAILKENQLQEESGLKETISHQAQQIQLLSEINQQKFYHQYENDKVQQLMKPEIAGNAILSNQVSLQSSEQQVIKVNPVVDERQTIHYLNQTELIQLISEVDVFSNLIELNLTGMKITDEGVKALAANGDKFKSLQKVSLGDNKITDEGVKALAANGDKFQSLQYVDLEQNKITNEGVNALAANGDKFHSLQAVILSKNNTLTSKLIEQVKEQYKFKFNCYLY